MPLTWKKSEAIRLLEKYTSKQIVADPLLAYLERRVYSVSANHWREEWRP